MSLPTEVTNYRPSRWPAPERHVLAIINFQDLADIATRPEFTPNNVDYLDAECRTHLGAIEEISLFTWCRHFDYREISQITVRQLCHLISTRIRDTCYRAILWNFFRAPTIWEKQFKSLKNLALGSLWKLGFGFLVGVHVNRPLFILNLFPDALEDLSFGACLAIGKYLESFCRNIIAIASGKRSVSRGFCSHFLLLLIT